MPTTTAITPIETFDVVVIGGGSAGAWVADNVARGGRSTALAEERLVGGECPYFACIPAKAMLHAAEIRHLAAVSTSYGATSQPLELDPPQRAYHAAVALRNRISEHHDDSSAERGLVEAGVRLFRGRGRVIREGVVEVGGTEIGYHDLAITTGTTFATPPVEGIDQVDAWGSEDFFHTSDELPASLVVLGGGPIGCEVAQVANRFGAQVTIVELAPRLLPAEEPEVATELQHALAEAGIVLRTGTAATRVETLDSVGGGDGGVRMALSDGSAVTAERLLVAVGKRPQLAGLGLEALGVDTAPGHYLEVDAAGRVHGHEHLWAGGDITGIAPFTHTANYHGRLLTTNLLGGDQRADHRAIPRGVYTDPGVASVGLSEANARAAGHDVVTASHGFSDTARGFATRRGGGLLKLVADRDSGLLLGAAAVGPHVEELIGEAVIAIHCNIPIATLAEVIHPFPTYSEAYEPPLRELAATLRA